VILAAYIQKHGIQGKILLDQAGNLADQAGGIVVQHHLLAQGVEAFHVSPALLGLLSLPASALGDTADDDTRNDKRDHRQPGLKTGKPKRMQRRKEKIVEEKRRNDRKIDGKRASNQRGIPHHQNQKQDACGCGVRLEMNQHIGDQHSDAGAQHPAQRRSQPIEKLELRHQL